MVINTNADHIIIANVSEITGRGPSGSTYRSGVLGKAVIRQSVCEILEGGEAAPAPRKFHIKFQHLERLRQDDGRGSRNALSSPAQLSRSLPASARIVDSPALMSIKEARGLLRYQTAMIDNSACPTWRDGKPYWSRPAIEVPQEYRSMPTGPTSTEARDGLSHHWPDTFADRRREQALAVLLRRFCNPLVLIGIVAAIVSCVVREGREAVIAAIIPASCGLGFGQEYSASHAVDALKQRITIAYALVSKWSKRLFFEHDRHHSGPRQRARHGRATVPGRIEDDRSDGHRQGALVLSAGPDLEATGAHRR